MQSMDEERWEDRANALTRQPEEQRYIVVGAHIAARMQRQDAVFGHEVVHDCEDALLHLPRVLAAQNDHFSGLHIPSNTRPINCSTITSRPFPAACRQLTRTPQATDSNPIRYQSALALRGAAHVPQKNNQFPHTIEGVQ